VVFLLVINFGITISTWFRWSSSLKQYPPRIFRMATPRYQRFWLQLTDLFKLAILAMTFGNNSAIDIHCLAANYQYFYLSGARYEFISSA
jgi:hypothetical protein